MNKEISIQLSALCDTTPARLRLISEEEFSIKPSANKWSKKELLGHLIDSAANNHQRFVRTQFETPVIYYEQDLWVNIQDYQNETTMLLIDMWEIYNRHLAHVISRIPQDKHLKTTIGRDGKEYTLEYVVKDYLDHLEYHLKQIIPNLK